MFSPSLSVCLLPPGHNLKPIFTKLHHLVEFVGMKKPIVFEEKRSKSSILKVNVRSGIRTHASMWRPEHPTMSVHGKLESLESGALERLAILTPGGRICF